MNPKPPKAQRLLRPTFGFGVVIGVIIIIASQASGSTSALGMALGGGVGVLLGLMQLSRSGKEVVEAAPEEAGQGRR